MYGKLRASFYAALARLHEAGLGLEAQFDLLLAGSAPARWSAALKRLHAGLRRGEPLSEQLAHEPATLFPPHHAPAIRAGEQSGELPRILRALAHEDEGRLRSNKELLSRAAYPLLLIHLAVIGPNAGLLITSPPRFVLSCLAILLPLDLLLFLLFRALSGGRMGPRMARLWLGLPLVGRVVHAREYRAWFEALALLYEAGVPIVDAARQALGAAANPELRAALAGTLKPLEQGEPFTHVLALQPRLAAEVRAVLFAAEPAGQLTEGLTRAAEWYREAQEQGGRRLVKVGGGILLGLAMLWAAYRILSFYADYYGALAKL